MNCQETEQLILDAFETPLSAAEQESVREHCSHCSTCVQFAKVQSELDDQLRQFIAAPTLNTDFRNLLNATIRQRHRAALWSPDIAYAIGALVALIVSILVLPFKAETVFTFGVAMCVGAYVLQSFMFAFVNESSDE